MSDDEEWPPELILVPDGDGVLVWIDPRYEQVFTAEQVKRMSEGNQPGQG